MLTTIRPSAGICSVQPTEHMLAGPLTRFRAKTGASTPRHHAFLRFGPVQVRPASAYRRWWRRPIRPRAPAAAVKPSNLKFRVREDFPGLSIPKREFIGPIVINIHRERGFCLLKGIAEGTYNSKHAEAARRVREFCCLQLCL